MSAKSRKRKSSSQALPKPANLNSTVPDLPPYDHVIQGYERALFLDQFLDSGREPAVSDVEIAVCFADLRGFTKYVAELQSRSADARVHQFLGAYFQIYPKAILEMVYQLEPRGAAKNSVEDEEIRKAIVPSTYKTLGDGMMLVWEFPKNVSLHERVSGRILQVVKIIQRLFQGVIAEFGDASRTHDSVAIKNLHLGFGLARGRAWRFDFGRRRPVDYAGNIVNLAARLQDRARPEGVVAEVNFCYSVFGSAPLKGQIVEITVKGREEPISVWASHEVDLNP
jgi:class 3 adenylate cyclase